MYLTVTNRQNDALYCVEILCILKDMIRVGGGSQQAWRVTVSEICMNYVEKVAPNSSQLNQSQGFIDILKKYLQRYEQRCVDKLKSIAFKGNT